MRRTVQAADQRYNFATKLARHLGVLTAFAALAVAWTWPLVLHLDDAIPGDPGDNYGCVWNLWWMRHVLATPGLPYFHTTYLFYPFGTTIVDHPHMALPSLVGATLLKPLSVIAAQNIIVLLHVCLNMACMYALAWSIGRHLRAAVLAGVVFGLSPYVAAHMLGHFELIAGWTLPLFALAIHRAATAPDGRGAAYAAGVVLAATAYISYYYVVYQWFFATVYLLAWSAPFAVTRATAARTGAARRLTMACAAGACACALIAAAIEIRGGWSFTIGSTDVSMRAPQNTLTLMWIFALGWLIAIWRPRVRANTIDVGVRGRIGTALAIAACIAVVFVAGTAPLLWQAARLVARGEYVTPAYSWRYVPLGIDLLAPLLGHPLHPLFGGVSTRAYTALGQNAVEAIGWFGIVPLALLATTRRTAEAATNAQRDFSAVSASSAVRREIHVWRIVGVTFFIWALGPFLTIGGFDTGLKLPAILLRYVPFVANARMPGRAVVVVFMSLAALLALQVGAARGRLRSPVLQWLAIVLIAFEYWAAPLRLTTVDWPPVYRALAAAPPGAVCEVPLGIGDGLGVGVGSQERRVLLYATEHEHPIVGGYIGRMPADAADRYRRMPIAGTLLALSDGAPLPASPDLDVTHSPCTYLVVDRRSISAPMASYLERLAPRRLAADDGRELLQIR